MLVVTKADDEDEARYKNLLNNQLSWCNSHKDTITKRARELYKLVSGSKADERLRARCCNFVLDKKLCGEYHANAADDGDSPAIQME